MRRRILIFVFGCLMGLVLSVGGFAYIVLSVGRDHIAAEEWFPDVLKMKRILAERTPSPRILLTAGSGTMFGVDSEVLAKSIGLPVVNMALHASLPLEFYCAEMRRQARKGDVILMPLEVTSFYNGTLRERLCGDFPLSVLFGIAPEYARAIPPPVLASTYLRYGLEWICRTVRRQTYCADTPAMELERRWRTERAGVEYGGYGFRGLTERGDMLVRRLSSPMPLRQWKMPAVVSSEFLSVMRDFTAEMKSRGVTVILVWSNLLWYPDETGFEGLRTKLASGGVPLHGRPEAFSFPASCYYDTAYHLNARGAVLNAMELAKIVSLILDRPLNLPAAASEHVVFAERDEALFPSTTDRTVYASGVRVPPGTRRLHLDVPLAFRRKASRLNFILAKSSSAGLKRIVCRGVEIPCRSIPHEFCDEVEMTIPKSLTGVASLDLMLTLSDPVGFERMTWIEAARPVRLCSGFAGEWTIGEHAEFELTVPEELRGRDGVLEISLKPSEEMVSVWCGDTRLGRYDLAWESVVLRVPVPAKAMVDELVRFRLELSRIKSPKERGWSTDERKLGPRVVSIRFEQ